MNDCCIVELLGDCSKEKSPRGLFCAAAKQLLARLVEAIGGEAEVYKGFPDNTVFCQMPIREKLYTITVSIEEVKNKRYATLSIEQKSTFIDRILLRTPISVSEKIQITFKEAVEAMIDSEICKAPRWLSFSEWLLDDFQLELKR